MSHHSEKLTEHAEDKAQEWPDAPALTEEQQRIVKDLAVTIVNHANTSVRERLIAVAINASITAERERCCEIWRIGKAELAAEQELRDEARAQRDHLIKECGRIGVTVNVAIGAPITEAYVLVNTLGDTTDAAIDSAVDAAHQEILILRQNLERDIAAAQQPLVDALTFYMKICGNTAYQLGRDTAREMYDCGKSALAKVKEGR